jgi:G:T-mismatch repair DNA endonuclease (very short patch repair protein)
MQVVKKIQQGLFDDVLLGKKKAEFRLNDFDMQEGDILKLVEVDKNNIETGRSIDKKVTYVWKCDLKDTYWPIEVILEKGIQVISFE